jgi:membrane protease YdiL (CAAX protease family)
MSNDTNTCKPPANAPGADLTESSKSISQVTWGPWTAVIVALVVFLLAQIIAAQAISIYPLIKHWSQRAAVQWINNSVTGQFFYYLVAEALTVAAIIGFIRWRKSSIAAIGLKHPRQKDIAYAFIGLVVYLPLLIVAVLVFKEVFPRLDLSQQQAVGFSSSVTGWPLLLVFFSLVIMPPIAEEIMFRGFVYSGLKRNLPKIWAVILTCAVFAAPHLLESVGSGPLWVAGIDTFVLSLVLIWLREKTGRLYASMGLHALKNFIAFIQLYPIIHLR